MRVLDLSSVSRPQDRAERAAPLLGPNTAACIGAFDGMHLGHQALIARARACAPEVAVVTFEPRPVDLLAPDRAPARLQLPRQRARVCRDLGVDTLVVLGFDREVSRMSPAQFVQRFLIEALGPRHVVVGYDFRFGAGRAGGPAELGALLEVAGIALSVVDKIAAQTRGGVEPTEKLGSTAIRRLASEGLVDEAAHLLGRLYAVAGPVVHGAARGRTIGFPTANIQSQGLLPAPGVYAGFLSLLDQAGEVEVEHWPAVANIGTNPTFDPQPRPGLEVHALDVDLGERLYAREVEFSFVAKLRDERRFDGPEALRAAITRDIEQARPLLSGRHARRFATSVTPAPPVAPALPVAD